MTQKEITRLGVINQTIDGVLTIREAADLLGLSERVEKEKIDKILTGALTAPSGRNITSIITIIIQLMAQSLGLGSCWIQVRERLTQDNERVSDYVKKILSIPENYEVEAMVPLDIRMRKRKHIRWT